MEFLGDINLAKKMILSAKRSGADAVKFKSGTQKTLEKVLGIKMVEENFTKNHF